MAPTARRLAARFVRHFVLVFAVSVLLGAAALPPVKRHAPELSPRHHQGFDLFVSREEMNRTLGLLAEMNYVSDGIVNAYSTKFPYRIAANISHLVFTWHAHNLSAKIKYNMQVSAEDFDVVPVLHIPAEGYIPIQPQTFAVEYRCAGSRAGQFQVTLHVEVDWPASQRTAFTLRQEKICASLDGRRAGYADAASRGGDGLPLGRRQTVVVVLAVCGAVVLLCILLACGSVNASRKRAGCAGGGSALAPMMGAGAAAQSFYTAAAMLGRTGFNDQVSPVTNFCAATTTTTTRMSTPASAMAANGGGATAAPTLAGATAPTITGAGSSRTASAALDGVVNLDDALVTRPLCLDYDDEDAFDVGGGSGRPLLTSTPYSNANVPRIPRFETLDKPKIVFARRGHLVDISHALVELNADRNLFVVMPQIELEGTFGEIRWANWRQTGIGTSGDIDDEEDDANEDTALICKTLKSSADRAHFETFLREALMLHNLPAHPNLAQVVAAATFGNFNNPNSIKDFPLICYRHSGFGILKKFLCTCRGINGAINAAAAAAAAADAGGGVDTSRKLSKCANGDDQPRNLLNPTLRVHDLVSIAVQILKAVQHLHTFGVIHKDIATRNCLISEVPMKLASSTDRLHVQLMDSALSRDIFPDDYTPIAVAAEDASPAGAAAFDVLSSSSAEAAAPGVGFRTELFPIRWMAPEAIRSKVFNSSTDVWTFGMLMWELFTCGQTPFADVAPADVELAIASGARPAHPAYNCPDEIYGIMFSCWHHDPLQRPSTDQLLRVIADFAHQLRRYI